MEIDRCDERREKQRQQFDSPIKRSKRPKVAGKEQTQIQNKGGDNEKLTAMVREVKQRTDGD